MPASLSPDLGFLLSQQRSILEELRGVQEDCRNLMLSLPRVLERIREQDKRFDELERRIDILNDDLVTNVKIELGGSFAQLETRLEQAVDSKLDVVKAELLAAMQR